MASRVKQALQERWGHKVSLGFQAAWVLQAKTVQQVKPDLQVQSAFVGWRGRRVQLGSVVHLVRLVLLAQLDFVDNQVQKVNKGNLVQLATKVLLVLRVARVTPDLLEPLVPLGKLVLMA